MTISKIIICILAFIAFGIARHNYDKTRRFGINYERGQKCLLISKIATGVGIVLSIALFVLLIITWSLFTLGLILLFITICLYIILKKDIFWPQFVAVGITTIVLTISVLIYSDNFEKLKTPEIYSEKTEIICVNDSSQIKGNFYHGIGSVKQDGVYNFYYKTSNGAEPASIPMNKTEIIFISEDETPYVETITKVYYLIDHNEDSPTPFPYSEEVEYKLYIYETALSSPSLDAEY